MATANDIIKEAKKLEGYKATSSSCIPNNWYYGGNTDGIRSTGVYFCAKYKTSPLDTSTYYDWQIDTNTDNGMDGYAGTFGVAMDKLCLDLV